jgi:hypothetical protein
MGHRLGIFATFLMTDLFATILFVCRYAKVFASKLPFDQRCPEYIESCKIGLLVLDYTCLGTKLEGSGATNMYILRLSCGA